MIKKCLCTWLLYCNYQVHRDFLITLYTVRFITGMANKHLLQQIVFIFRDMFVCLLWLSISQIIHHALTNSDIKNNRWQRDRSLKMNCCNRCVFTIQIITNNILGDSFFILVTILIYCIFTVLLHIYMVGSRFATVRFMTIHFYDPCRVGPSTPGFGASLSQLKCPFPTNVHF